MWQLTPYSVTACPQKGDLCSVNPFFLGSIDMLNSFFEAKSPRFVHFLLKCRYVLFHVHQMLLFYFVLAFLSLWVKRNFRGWGALAWHVRLILLLEQFVLAQHGLNDYLAIDLMALLFAVWPWLFQVSGMFSFFSFLNVLCHSPLYAIILKCLYLLFADGEIQGWWPLDILLFLVLSHRHGWADKVKCFYVFDRRGVRL